jgi:hypothetical protein
MPFGTSRWFGCLVAVLGLQPGCAGDDDDRAPGAGGGGALPVPEVPITKFDLLGAGEGSALHDEQCEAHALAPGCDLCDALGFYDDRACDTALVDAGLCAGPDPDCAPRAADFYIAPDGDDANDGSASHPFATVQRAHDAAAPGSLLYLRGGTYHPVEPTLFTAEGSADAPIVLQSYPGELPIIDATGLPEGDVESGSTATWSFRGAKHWQVRGPLQLVNGRGAGVLIEEDTRDVTFAVIESSYNGWTAARGGHGFLIVEDEWADAEDIRFIDCDAHHNANHRTLAGEDVAENLYQHGDGWRIKSGRNVQLVGCRSWHNLDDNFDLVWATEPILLHECWSGFAGRDDAMGSITGTPGFEAAWGEGIKLGYTDDTGPHSAIRCLSWKNVHLGYRMDGGPYLLESSASFENGRRALGWELGPRPHVLRNSLDLATPNATDIPATTTSSHNSWDADSAFSVGAEDFVSLDDTLLLGPRSPDGSLPVVDFMRLVSGSDLVDAGLPGSAAYGGSAPDIGCFERP